MSTTTFGMADEYKSLFSRKARMKWQLFTSLLKKKESQVLPLYKSLGQSSRGDIPFFDHRVILYEETHHLYIEASNSRSKLTLMGWGNIPGRQHMQTDAPFRKGAYFADFDAHSFFIAVKGNVEIKAFDEVKYQTDLFYEFEMLQTDEALVLSRGKTFAISGMIKGVNVSIESIKKAQAPS